jgi:hypothetical protein
MSSPASLHSEPAEEEDISRAGAYHDDRAQNHTSTAGRKGKQRAENPFDVDEAGESLEEDHYMEEGYPPTNDEEAEARRVAEVRSLSV